MRLLLLILGLHLGVTAIVTQPAAAATPAVTPHELTLVSYRHTNATPLVEGPNDTNIVKVVAQILQSQHYLRLKLNDALSARFYDRFIDSLDNLHLYFTQADIRQFEKYRYHLDELTLEQGDTAPAREIFTRWRERLEQQFEFVQNALAHDKFEFTNDDRFVVDRKNLPRPADLTEARHLWGERLRYEYLQEKLNKEKPAEIIKNLTRRYTRVIRTVNEYDNDDVLQIYLTALAHVYDPHSDYMGKHELENFNISMKLSLFGIGAVLESEDGYCKIRSLQPEGPAERSKKLKPKDRIVAVAQSNAPPVDVVDMKLNKVVELIRGPKATEVRLTIIPADATDPSNRRVISLVRDEIKLEEQAAKAKIIEMPPRKDDEGREVSQRLGVIDLPSFYSSFELEGRRGPSDQKSTTTDVAALLRKLTQEKVSGVILDLRRNGGGSLEEAINLTGLFIKEGPVVQVKSPDGLPDVDNDPDGSVWYDGPLIVLTSRFSASASEILAGALQDYGRALIVGDISTHGKGTVQSLLQLRPIMRQAGILSATDPGAIKYTIRKFYRASGASTQLKGVTPDLVLPSVNNHLEVGESSLDNPMTYDIIPPAAGLEKLNRVEPFLAELKKRSDARVASDADFAYVRDDEARYKKAKAEKSISLNEAVRLKEKKESDERSKARKKELAARPEPAWKVYDISLKQVRTPGLPPPTVRTNAPKSAASSTNKSISIGKDNAGKDTKPAPATTDIAKADPADNDADGDDAELDVQAPDITLEETKRILQDYIELATKGRGVALNKPTR